MPDPDWGVEVLDLGAYLERVGLPGDHAPSLATLAALHRAHLRAVPFENADVMLGRGVDVGLPSVQDKLVHARRGGYCYEQNTLFGAVVERIGLPVERLLARVGDPAVHPTPRSHLVLRVSVDGRPWLADVGFGSGLLGPVPFDDPDGVRQGGWSYRVVRGADRAWRLQELRDTGWEVVYTIPEETTYPVDVEVANHNTSTHPSSPFTQRLVVITKDEQVVRRLHGRELTTTGPDSTLGTRQLQDGELGDALAAMGLRLAADDVAALSARRHA
jgi:N-hydroxyarylamine O-acetyltransferase